MLHGKLETNAIIVVLLTTSLKSYEVDFNLFLKKQINLFYGRPRPSDTMKAASMIVLGFALVACFGHF